MLDAIIKELIIQSQITIFKSVDLLTLESATHPIRIRRIWFKLNLLSCWLLLQIFIFFLIQKLHLFHNLFVLKLLFKLQRRFKFLINRWLNLIHHLAFLCNNLLWNSYLILFDYLFNLPNFELRYFKTLFELIMLLYLLFVQFLSLKRRRYLLTYETLRS